MFGRATERHMTPTAKLLLLGSGELGQDIVVSRMVVGCRTSTNRAAHVAIVTLPKSRVRSERRIMFGRATERHSTPSAKILLLGSCELGREFVISAKRLGCHVIACDSYAGAPAMQVADAFGVFSMLDGDALRAAIEKHRPDHIVPEVEAIRTEILAEVEDDGFHIVPSARAAQLTMNRDAIRDLAASELGLATSD